MPYKVSVNIVCYNHEEYIGQAIESVLAQTLQDFELQVLDNGSTDNSLKVIESYKDDRIKIESISPNQQSTLAGKKLMEKSTGEYVALLCSDDLWEKDKLRQQVEYLDNNKECGAVFTRVQPISLKGEDIKDKNNPYNKQFNTLENRSAMKWLRSIWETADHSFCCSSAVVRKKVLEEAGYHDVRLKHIQDMNLWANILTRHEVFILNEKLTKMRYFNNGSNLSARRLRTDFSILNESYILYKQFNKIPSIEKFIEFKPETKSRFQIIKPEYIPFYLSILTLENNPKIHFKKSALNMLYDIMENKDYRETLEKDFNFTHMDLYKISEEFYPEIFRKQILGKIFNIR